MLHKGPVQKCLTLHSTPLSKKWALDVGPTHASTIFFSIFPLRSFHGQSLVSAKLARDIDATPKPGWLVPRTWARNVSCVARRYRGAGKARRAVRKDYGCLCDVTVGATDDAGPPCAGSPRPERYRSGTRGTVCWSLFASLCINLLVDSTCFPATTCQMLAPPPILSFSSEICAFFFSISMKAVSVLPQKLETKRELTLQVTAII